MRDERVWGGAALSSAGVIFRARPVAEGLDPFRLEGVWRGSPGRPGVFDVADVGMLAALDAMSTRGTLRDGAFQDGPPHESGVGRRERMIDNGMDRVLLERTVALVGEGVVATAEGQQLSKAVRLAIDSRPFTEQRRE